MPVSSPEHVGMPSEAAPARSAGARAVAWFRASRRAAALEVVAVLAAAQLFLWHYSRTHRRGWLPILAWMLISMVVRRETAEKAGLAFRQGWDAMRWLVLGIALPAVPLLVYGARQGRVELLAPDALALAQFGGYLLWCLLQQFALQSYLHSRLLEAVPNRHFSSAIIALGFSSLHLPNPVLTVATLAGGFVMAEIFARYRNIWVLALGQALVSTVIFVSLPDAWHHRLRVGPGFWWWEVAQAVGSKQ